MTYRSNMLTNWPEFVHQEQAHAVSTGWPARMIRAFLPLLVLWVPGAWGQVYTPTLTLTPVLPDVDLVTSQSSSNPGTFTATPSSLTFKVGSATATLTFLSIDATWQFDPPIPHDGSFSASISFNYNATELMKFTRTVTITHVQREIAPVEPPVPERCPNCGYELPGPPADLPAATADLPVSPRKRTTRRRRG
jgi:hypothetical protein